MNKASRLIKRYIALILVLLFSIESFAAVVGDNDGAAFITKAEFDSLKNDFQSQLDRYNSSIDNKIDGAIASYLAGVDVTKTVTVKNLISNLANKIFWISSTSWKQVANTKIPWNIKYNQYTRNGYVEIDGTVNETNWKASYLWPWDEFLYGQLDTEGNCIITNQYKIIWNNLFYYQLVHPSYWGKGIRDLGGIYNFHTWSLGSAKNYDYGSTASVHWAITDGFYNNINAAMYQLGILSWAAAFSDDTGVLYYAPRSTGETYWWNTSDHTTGNIGFGELKVATGSSAYTWSVATTKVAYTPSWTGAGAYDAHTWTLDELSGMSLYLPTPYINQLPWLSTSVKEKNLIYRDITNATGEATFVHQGIKLCELDKPGKLTVKVNADADGKCYFYIGTTAIDNMSTQSAGITIVTLQENTTTTIPLTATEKGNCYFIFLPDDDSKKAQVEFVDDLTFQYDS